MWYHAFSLIPAITVVLSSPKGLQIPTITNEKKTVPTASPGDPARGAQVFQTNCAACHHATPESGSPGPPLFEIKKVSRRTLVNTHLTPRTPVAEGYEATLFILEDGDSVTGIIDQESPTEVILRTPKGLKTLNPEEITSRKVLAKTLKPPGIFNTMKAEDVRDLIAWLTAPASQESKHDQAMPLPESNILEAEDLRSEASGGTLIKRNMNPFRNAHWGGNHILKWFETEPGDKLQLYFNVEEAGIYRIGGVFVRASHYMTASVTLDGQKKPLIPSLDLYHPTVVPTVEIALFEGPLTAGEHRLTFTIVGANPQKRSGAKIMSIDFLTLNKTKAPPVKKTE